MIFPIVSFFVKIAFNITVFTFCVLFILAMLYVWLMLIQGIIQGSNEDDYIVENKIVKNKVPDVVIFDKKGNIGEHYDL